MKYINKSDLSGVCSVLNQLSNLEWKVNKQILETVEYIWSIGGGMGEIPKRYNDRTISPEMIKEASFREKLKLLKEHK